jgi:hypothetical protein
VSIGPRRSRSKQRLLEHKRIARKRTAKRFPREVQPDVLDWAETDDGYDESTDEDRDDRTR